MAITVGQITAAIATIKTMDQTLTDLTLLLSQAKELSDKGWQVDIGSRASVIVTVSPAQQAAMIAQYDTFKASLVTAFQQLP